MEQHMPELPLIDRLKIAAEFIVPIVKQMEEELGKEQAQAIVRRGASKQFRQMAKRAVRSADGNSGQALMALNSGVRQGVDIVTDMRPTSEGFDMDVTACVYARFFQELGEPELGFLLVCSADFDIVDEMDDVQLDRSQTIMQGADHCDFKYRFLAQ
jgi:predicted ArsR family transcriptional regulator